MGRTGVGETVLAGREGLAWVPEAERTRTAVSVSFLLPSPRLSPRSAPGPAGSVLVSLQALPLPRSKWTSSEVAALGWLPFRGQLLPLIAASRWMAAGECYTLNLNPWRKYLAFSHGFLCCLLRVSLAWRIGSLRTGSGPAHMGSNVKGN